MMTQLGLAAAVLGVVGVADMVVSRFRRKDRPT